MYKENPKTKGSGILCAIPQTGTCPNKCEDCFFQSGRSYLEPLEENLPNIPHSNDYRVVRINDGNDSNVQKRKAVNEYKRHDFAFFNTAIPKLDFPGPVVLTINPGKITNTDYYRIDNPPKNLMFVRFRCSTWNLWLADKAVNYYGKRETPIVLTFMAYHGTQSATEIKIPYGHRLSNYVERKRTLNSYWAITTTAWRKVMQRYEDNKWVYSCGKIEGEKGDTHCRFCGNCLREYFATLVRMNGE